jgi:hypothetical protein
MGGAVCDSYRVDLPWGVLRVADPRSGNTGLEAEARPAIPVNPQAGMPALRFFSRIWSDWEHFQKYCSHSARTSLPFRPAGRRPGQAGRLCYPSLATTQKSSLRNGYSISSNALVGLILRRQGRQGRRAGIPVRDWLRAGWFAMGGAAAHRAALREHGTGKSREPADRNVCATLIAAAWQRRPTLIGFISIP